jgi:hypothetical protein
LLLESKTNTGLLFTINFVPVSRNLLLVIVLLSVPVLAFSQKKADRQIEENLRRHLSQLQSPAGNGPAALQYVAQQLKAMGIPAAAPSGYIQPIIHDGATRYQPGTTLAINGQSLSAGKDFVPLVWSGQGSAKGEPLVAVQERHQPWIVDVDASSDTPSQDSTLYALAQKAQADQATAILLYSSSARKMMPEFHAPAAFPALSIPVVYLDQASAQRFFADQTASVSIEVQVGFSQEKDTSYLLTALVDHHAGATLELAAGDAGSQAALLEMARLLNQGKSYAGQNYRLVAYNGDSLRLSERVKGVFYLKDLSHLDASTPTLAIVGIPPAGKWAEAFDKAKSKALVIQKTAAADPAGMPVVHLKGSPQGQDNLAAETIAIRYITDAIRGLNR